MKRSLTRRQAGLAHKTAELMFAAPQVVAMRTARMLAAGANPNARDRREFQRMSAEKADAFTEAWSAMATQMWRSNQAIATSMMNQWWRASMQAWTAFPVAGKRSRPAAFVPASLQWQHAMLSVLAEGLAPVHRRAVSNARRLAGTRRR